MLRCSHPTYPNESFRPKSDEKIHLECDDVGTRKRSYSLGNSVNSTLWRASSIAQEPFLSIDRSDAGLTTNHAHTFHNEVCVEYEMSKDRKGNDLYYQWSIECDSLCCASGECAGTNHSRSPLRIPQTHQLDCFSRRECIGDHWLWIELLYCLGFFRLQTKWRIEESWEEQNRDKRKKKKKTNACSYCYRLEVQCLFCWTYMYIDKYMLTLFDSYCWCLFVRSICTVWMSMLMRKMGTIFLL